MIILNEREYAEDCLQSGIINNNPYITLSILAKYYYHHLGFRKKKITKLLLEFLAKYYPRYEMNEMSWIVSAEKIASNAGKYPLFEISGVKITKSEMKTISDLNNKVLERLAFTMLCLAKLSDAKSPSNNGWVNTESKDIFKYARISSTIIEREKKIGRLWQLGLLEFPKRNDNLNCRVTFINDDDKEEIFVDDFRELGYVYLKYKGENFIKCAECGILTRGNKYGNKKYCNSCSSSSVKISKTIFCIDCGKRVDVSAKDHQTNRCHDCYTKYRKQYKSQKELERYYRNNNSKS